jgi:hypothetical protein
MVDLLNTFTSLHFSDPSNMTENTFLRRIKQWFTPITLATEEAEIERVVRFQAKPGKNL